MEKNSPDADGEVRVGHGDVVLEALRDVVDLDDGATRVAGGPVLSGRAVDGGGVCAGQGKPPSCPHETNNPRRFTPGAQSVRCG